jgi:murein DD-endopeptidase MepM/ murein hydrolase activator NlpD
MKQFPLPVDAPYSYGESFTVTHQGVDIFAPLNTPVLAVDRGLAWTSVEPKGGNVVYLQAVADGKRYFYGHLNGWATKLFGVTKAAPVQVEAGETIAFVGNTGNAAGKATHTHFLMRMDPLYGGQVVDPFPALMAVDPKKAGEPLKTDFDWGWWEDLKNAREGLRKVATVALVIWLASKVMDRR